MTNNEITKAYLGSEEVTKIYQGNTVIYEKETDYSKMPLTFEILSGGTINWIRGNNGQSLNIEYSVNGDNWISITATTGGTPINVNSGDVVSFRGNNSNYQVVGQQASSYRTAFSFTENTKINVKGNIMSMLYGDNYINQTTLNATNTFNNFFFRCNAINSVEHLVLPATTLVNSCYFQMFYECTSLTTAPELPATTLADDCYWSMFNGCTSLTTAPVLPATTLRTHSYMSMFRNCTNLNYIKCLATSLGSSINTENWVQGVAASGTFVTPSTTNWSTGTSGIPSGWTRVYV